MGGTITGAAVRHMRRQSVWSTNLVETKTLAAGIPRKGAEEGVEVLGGIPKGSEVFTKNNDQIGTELFGICN